MGVFVVRRDREAALRRVGVAEDKAETCYARICQRFFADATLGREFLDRICIAAHRGGLRDELSTDWLCLDCELMPWSWVWHSASSAALICQGCRGSAPLRGG
jgi:protein phosphatase